MEQGEKEEGVGDADVTGCFPVGAVARMAAAAESLPAYLALDFVQKSRILGAYPFEEQRVSCRASGYARNYVWKFPCVCVLPEEAPRYHVICKKSSSLRGPEHLPGACSPPCSVCDPLLVSGLPSLNHAEISCASGLRPQGLV